MQLTVTFPSFDTEGNYDKVFVYDGPDVNAPQLGDALSGNNIPDPVSSTGSSITIKFTSDGSATRAGFSFMVTENGGGGGGGGSYGGGNGGGNWEGGGFFSIYPLQLDTVNHLNYGNNEDNQWTYTGTNPSNHVSISC